MTTQITIEISVNDKKEASQVQKALQTINTHFGAKGIIKMEQLFLNDAFVRNLVKTSINM
ncbi:hypothetical protein [Aquimarina longa]|uniref:hypothetical protein n=1 Tax=Aquimarina longa TaxID=1080221 RepID=UPI00078674CA|nr:hypothetical protein [Aquimarina longa]